jgi:hypothetical protein
MSRTLGPICAVWLIAQILLPFTAPFPTCDVSDLLGSTHHQGAPLLPSHSRAEGDYTFAPPLTTTSGRLKLVVVSSLDASGALGHAPVIAAGRPFTVAVGGPNYLQNQPTVLRL